MYKVRENPLVRIKYTALQTVGQIGGAIIKRKQLKKQLMQTPVEMTPKQIQKAKDEATMQAVSITNILPLLVLRDEFGFGKKRLQQYINALNRQVDAFNGGYISLKEVVDAINSETGLGYMEGEEG